MAWSNTGYKRSLKISTTKTGDNTPPTIISIIEDGQQSFLSGGVTYNALTDEEFARLVHNESNTGTWDVRVNAFKSYIQDKYSISDPGLYPSIDWTLTRAIRYSINVNILELSQARIYAETNPLVNVPDTLTITVLGADNSPIVFTINSGSNTSTGYVDMTESQGVDIRNLHTPSVSPLETANAVYSVSIIV